MWPNPIITLASEPLMGFPGQTHCIHVAAFLLPGEEWALWGLSWEGENIRKPEHTFLRTPVSSLSAWSCILSAAWTQAFALSAARLWVPWALPVGSFWGLLRYHVKIVIDFNDVLIIRMPIRNIVNDMKVTFLRGHFTEHHCQNLNLRAGEKVSHLQMRLRNTGLKNTKWALFQGTFWRPYLLIQLFLLWSSPKMWKSWTKYKNHRFRVLKILKNQKQMYKFCTNK